MLILTRRVGEKLIIGENVTVTVLSVKGNQIRVGIDAPRDVSVNREEIFQRILEEQEAMNGNSVVKTPTPPIKTSVRTIKVPVRTLSLSDKRLREMG